VGARGGGKDEKGEEGWIWHLAGVGSIKQAEWWWLNTVRGLRQTCMLLWAEKNVLILTIAFHRIVAYLGHPILTELLALQLLYAFLQSVG